MKEPSHHGEVKSHDDFLDVLYKRHLQGAIVRSAASVCMGLFALAAFLTDTISAPQFHGISLSILYIILINPPTLLLLKRITNMRTYSYASLFINFLEVVGYTAIIYFLGGIEATFLTPIYAALITYVGAMSPWRFSYIIATMCSACFTFVVAGDYFGYLHPYRTLHDFYLPWLSKFTYLSVVIGLLYIVAYISSLTAGALKKNRVKLRERNLELLEKTKTLEEAENELRLAHQELEARVASRTLELARANEELESQLRARQQAEDSLRESEEKHRNILENIDEAYFEVDLKGNMTFHNDATCHIGGYTRSELRNMNYRQYTSPETANMLQGIFNKIYRTGERESLYDYEMIRKDKSTCSMELSVNLMTNPEGEAIGFRCIARDITTRRQVEEERRKLGERLQRAEKMEALGTLAGGVAHDLNNVLGVVMGYSELLLMEMPEESPQKGRVSTIMQASQRASAIIQDLLTMARRGVAVSEVVNLNTVIADYFGTPEFAKLKAFHPHVVIKHDLTEDLPNIKGSPVHLGKTVMNLVSNASEAISGSGEVIIRTEQCYLDRPVRGYDDIKEGDYVVVKVSDNGSGISASDIKKIFEPFYTKKVMGKSGTGLGLSVVWGTVKDHGGYIDVQSEDDKGTTFAIYLPVTREEPTKDEQKTYLEQFAGKGETVLVVDDVKEQREVAISMLAKLGYRVDAVSSGEEAIVYLMASKADLVVLDMIMHPGMDGLETYQRILAINPNQKAIIVSGFSETERVRKAQKLGAGAYIRKPYMLEKIGLAVRKELLRVTNVDSDISELVM